MEDCSTQHLCTTTQIKNYGIFLTIMANRVQYNWESIIQRVRSGESVRDIAAEPDMPAASSIYTHVKKDLEKIPTSRHLTEMRLRYRIESLDVTTDDGWHEFERLMNVWLDWYELQFKLEMSKIAAEAKAKDSGNLPININVNLEEKDHQSLPGDVKAPE